MERSFLKIINIDKDIEYDGSQLSSHYIYKNFNIMGDACLSFTGKCDIPYLNMVDIEDIIAKDKIYSTKMLHFIIELFNKDIYFGILFQNAIISEIQNELLNFHLVKYGDDLFYEDKKFSISICTSSPLSTLIHLGLNIDSANTPVKTISLNDLNINVAEFKNKILARIQKEYTRVILAATKVRAIS